ncbi:MAG: UDP-N-acetylglucosamine 1-carboxyvinyltransferase [Planctomycetes bacterium]|nr:UDP-N-acetylglucosamine 1-carboxyvinyltransferase [Planctomycetota bacterium]
MPFKLQVTGGAPLSGSVTISGAKNAALPLMAAALLAPGKTVLHNVPDLSDVRLMCEILEVLGCETHYDNDTVTIDVQSEEITVAPYELVSEMRASFCVLGPLLARRGKADVALPGGCTLGVRPVDLHIKGLKALGAEVTIDAGYVKARGENMRGERIYLGGAMGPSVTGTCNILCAAVLTPGKTIIEEAACEPEVQNLVDMLIAMGANISGGGTPCLTVEGVKELQPVEFHVIPDRIEASTFVAAAAITGSTITLEKVNIDHLGKMIDLYKRMGVTFRRKSDFDLEVTGPNEITPIDVTTLPFPGFPTDVQAQTMAILSLAKGMSVITEKIYPDRFMVISEFNRMGAEIRKEGNMAVVHGVQRLSGCPVKATDLRAGAGLVLAGLVADGVTEVFNIHHIDRGYDCFEGKLTKLGAQIERVEFAAQRRRSDKIAAAREVALKLSDAPKQAA